MSALTDIFTSIANKIRNKLGVSTKYLPSEMPDAIDDVYSGGYNSGWSSGYSSGRSSARQGNASQADVLTGKTFTNSSSSGLSGTMPDKSVRDSSTPGVNSSYPTQPVWSGDTGSGQYITNTDGVERLILCPPEGYHPGEGLGYVGIPSQTKSVGSSLSAQTVSPDSGKVLKSVNVSAISPQYNSGTWVWNDSSTPAVATYTYSTGTTEQMIYTTPRPSSQGSTEGWFKNGARLIVGNANSLAQRMVKGYSLFGVSGAWREGSTYTFSEANGTTVDLGETNSYRYVNAVNVRVWTLQNLSSSTFATDTKTVDQGISGFSYDTKQANAVYLLFLVASAKAITSLTISGGTNYKTYYDNILINGNSSGGAYGAIACVACKWATSSNFTVKFRTNSSSSGITYILKIIKLAT